MFVSTHDSLPLWLSVPFTADGRFLAGSGGLRPSLRTLSRKEILRVSLGRPTVEVEPEGRRSCLCYSKVTNSASQTPCKDVVGPFEYVIDR